MINQRKLSMVLKVLREKQGIVLGEQLTLGNICKNIYKAKMSNKKVVIKIGINRLEQEEIEKNILGYQEMNLIGAKKIMPQLIQYMTILDLPLIIMEDCGLDFWHATQQRQEPEMLYVKLAQELSLLYYSTKNEPAKAIVALESIIERIARQYDKYLFPNFSHNKPDEILLYNLREKDIKEYSPRYSCFSSFDFTPEDVFLSPSGLRYVDPLPNLLGIPIIDLACFAGVARDAYNLPGSKYGYKILKKLALEKVPEIIGLNIEKSNQLFFLGRALQCALSSRFRIKKNLLLAESFYNKSKLFLKKFLNKQ